MNVDRGQTSFSEEEIAELRKRFQDHMSYEDWTWRQAEQATGIPAGTLSQWVPGKYKGDNSNVAYRVNKFFLSEEARKELEISAPIVPGFQHTKTSRLIHSQLQWAHRGEFVLILGAAGVGKTSSVDQYVATTPNAFKATMSPATRRPSAMLLAILRALGVTTRQGGSLQQLTDIASDRLVNRRAVLVVDEAQFLEPLALEQLRALHDAIQLGVALSGNPTVLTQIHGGARRAEFAQLSRRVSMTHVYERPYPEDVEILCNAWGVTHPKQREFLTKLAMAPGEGGVGTLTQTLKVATLLARYRDEEITLADLQNAWAERRPQTALA